VKDNIHTLSSYDFYLAKIDQNQIKDSYNFLQKSFSQFTDKTWNCNLRTSVNITLNILNIPALFNLKTQIMSHITQYMFAKEKYYDGYITGSWVNIYEKNYFQEFHTHDDEIFKYISGVCYLTENNSEIELKDPFNKGHKQIKPKLGDIILFDDVTPHRVIPNENDELRVSLAFNFVKKNIWPIV
tara:strand:+ start:12909 stop:13463 length:555 start_codon:yes stop_codon:yes gene_type:complete